MSNDEVKEKYKAYINEVSELLGLGKPVDILKLCIITDEFFLPFQKRIAELEIANKRLADECHRLVDTLEQKQKENANIKIDLDSSHKAWRKLSNEYKKRWKEEIIKKSKKMNQEGL